MKKVIGTLRLAVSLFVAFGVTANLLLPNKNTVTDISISLCTLIFCFYSMIRGLWRLREKGFRIKPLIVYVIIFEIACIIAAIVEIGQRPDFHRRYRDQYYGYFIISGIPVGRPEQLAAQAYS